MNELDLYTLDQKSWSFKNIIGQSSSSPDDSSLIGFLQSGPGAVARSVQSKERDVVSVFDFMTATQIADVQARTSAVDVTAAIQAAIDYLATIAGGKIIFPRGIYFIAGILKDATRANAQILLPSISIFSPALQITIEFCGESAPTAGLGVNLGATGTSVSGVILATSLATSGGSILGIEGPIASGSNFSNVLFKASNMTFRASTNTGMTPLNLKWASGIELDNVQVDVGSYDITSYPLPTDSSSYGIRTPGTGNAAVNRVKSVTVAGFYHGMEVGEHFNATGQVAFYGCLQAVTFAVSSFPLHFDLLMLVHCQRGLVFTSTQLIEIDQLSLEHATDATWMVAVYDIDDASNFAKGTLRWGPSPAWTLLTNGAANLEIIALGTEMAAWATFVPVVTAAAGTFTSVVGTTRWKQDGKQVFFCTKVTITTNGTAATGVIVTLPVTAQGTLIQIAAGRATQISGRMLQMQIVSTTAQMRNYDNTYPGQDGEILYVSGVYEAA